jgi:hypothetical protein
MLLVTKSKIRRSFFQVRIRFWWMAQSSVLDLLIRRQGFSKVWIPPANLISKDVTPDTLCTSKDMQVLKLLNGSKNEGAREIEFVK